MSEYKTQSILPVMAQHLAHFIENTEKTSIAFQHEMTETLIFGEHRPAFMGFNICYCRKQTVRASFSHCSHMARAQ